MSVDNLINILQDLLKKPYKKRLLFLQNVLTQHPDFDPNSQKPLQKTNSVLCAIHEATDNKDPFVSQWMGIIILTSLGHFTHLRDFGSTYAKYRQSVSEFINLLIKKFMSNSYLCYFGRESHKSYYTYCEWSNCMGWQYTKQKREITSRSKISRSKITSMINLFEDNQLPCELQRFIVFLFVV